MKKIYLLLVCALMFFSANTNAQCTTTGRYTDFIFPTVTKDSVRYSTVTNQDMDVYQPSGDTFSLRPLIILGHGGSFITGNGDRTNDATVDSLCVRFAKRGYVTVSIDYRTTSFSNMLAATSPPDSAAYEVARAISDGKACIRYLVQHRATYRIDTNNIFIGGNSAGAVLYMHVGYIESITDCSPLILNALNNNGGFDGNSGNPGYTTRCKAIINLAGALNTIGLIHNAATPSVNCQGDQDNTVPYMCGLPLNGNCADTLCGLGSLEPQYVAKGIYHWSHVFAGQPHVPWAGVGAANIAMFITADSLVSGFLYTMVCTNISAVNHVSANTEVSLFPNPATEVLHINSSQALSGITMYDETGRTVLQAAGINKGNYEINTSHLGKGMYFIRIGFSDQDNSPIVRKVAIQ